MKTSQIKRYNLSRNWSPADFLKWYAGASNMSRDMAADYLFGMGDADVQALIRLANDLIDDLARNSKREIATSQLRDNEELLLY